MRNHRQTTFLRLAAMDVAVAPAHRAERRAHISPHGVQNGFSKSQPSRRVADERREHIGFFQGNSDCGAQGFLPASEKNPAVDFSGALERGELVVQQSREQHETIRGEMDFARRGNVAGRFGVEHRLQHGEILSPKPRASNVSFRRKILREKIRLAKLKKFVFNEWSIGSRNQP